MTHLFPSLNIDIFLFLCTKPWPLNIAHEPDLLWNLTTLIMLILFKSINLLTTIFTKVWILCPFIYFSLFTLLEYLAYNRLFFLPKSLIKSEDILPEYYYFNMFLIYCLSFNCIELISLPSTTDYFYCLYFSCGDWYMVKFYGNIIEMILKQWVQFNKKKFNFVN